MMFGCPVGYLAYPLLSPSYVSASAGCPAVGRSRCLSFRRGASLASRRAVRVWVPAFVLVMSAVLGVRLSLRSVSAVMTSQWGM